jgi:hypothetical protein
MFSIFAFFWGGIEASFRCLSGTRLAAEQLALFFLIIGICYNSSWTIVAKDEEIQMKKNGGFWASSDPHRMSS